MVIDAKVSLTAYEQYASAESDDERQAALRAHLTSIRNHIKRLSEKNYQSLYGLSSLDFVLMFIPVDPAFMLAVQNDRGLYMDALNKNIVLVGPTTLIATLRVIANIWRREHQNQNAQEIARQCAALYDKFVGFVKDLDEVGGRLAAAQRAYDDAKSKLSTGRGNVVRQLERVRQLGVKPTKSLPRPMLEAALGPENGIEDGYEVGDSTSPVERTVHSSRTTSLASCLSCRRRVRTTSRARSRSSGRLPMASSCLMPSSSDPPFSAWLIIRGQEMGFFDKLVSTLRSAATPSAQI